MAVNDSLQIKDPVAGTDVDLELAAGAGGKARPVVHIDSGDALPLPTNAAQETGGNLAGLVTRVGEVQASPTANSVLARLKDLLTGIVLAAGSAIIGKVGIDQTTPGTTNLVESRPSARRNAGALHRDGITAVDKLSAPGNPTLADVTTGGALLANTTYYVGILAVVLQGGSAEILGLSTVNASIQSQATAADASNTHIIRTTFSQVTNADAYLLFCSTDAAPKLVGYVTEAQRAAGGVLTAFGTVGAGGVAGAIDISLAGTGLQTSNAVFTTNTAHMPDTVAAVGAVACQGYSKAICTVRAQLSKATVWSAAPALTLVPWLKTQEGSADWAAGSPITLSLLGAASDALTQVFEVDVTGAVGLVLTCSTITGLASFDAWVELA